MKKAKKKEVIESVKITDSEIIAGIAYNKDTHEMGVLFTKGTIYTYPNIAYADYVEFTKADSKGKFFHRKFAGLDHFQRVR